MWSSGLEKHEWEQLSLQERMLLTFAEISSWKYAYSDYEVMFPYYRDWLPGSRILDRDPTKYSSDHRTNCSSMTAYVLFTVYPNKEGFGGSRWTAQDYKDLQIMDAKRPWSPIECVGSKPFGKVVDDPVPLEWHLSQKWKSLSPLKSGHARIVRCLDDGDTLLVLEATNRNDLGVTASKISWQKLKSDNAGSKLVLLK